ncbi:transcriptional regulator [Virgisporangium aliadipatigenens]|uniref:Transcriptional regulator n=1 Tax=Virgisporangium aliadipatigenens TaxID=741659 RepID=A0A8J3YGF9_9ACTN|nr:helix-turn-helix domain-containing protein [Virgisporangium aliadipatigenens]GIJ43792.1 transcriptional regulator [Virgisporangium aliadipatigenens]
MSESQVLAALAHPLRRRLVEVLRAGGPSTVGALAAHTAQAVGNVSHHIRVLAAAGLVEEAPELARDRRERWWRPVPRRPVPAGLDAHGRRVREWDSAPSAELAAWGDAPFRTDRWLHLTPAELARLGTEIEALLERWSRRPAPEEGERGTVFVFAHGVPARP